MTRRPVPAGFTRSSIDGHRIIATVQGGVVRLSSRPGNDATKRFASVAEWLRQLPASTAILDGEVAVPDERGVTHIELPQRRPACARAARLLRIRPAVAEWRRPPPQSVGRTQGKTREVAPSRAAPNCIQRPLGRRWPRALSQDRGTRRGRHCLEESGCALYIGTFFKLVEVQTFQYRHVPGCGMCAGWQAHRGTAGRRGVAERASASRSCRVSIARSAG
jgi:hypothetical protein